MNKHIKKAQVSDHYDSGYQYFTVDKVVEDERTLVTHAQVLKYLEENGFHATYCQHDYDCCGKVYFNQPVVLFLDRPMEQWVVRQNWWRNV